MRKHIIKTGIILLAGLLCLFALSFSASAEGTAELMETYSGTCGENLTWTLDTATGELVISGTGNMTPWMYQSSVPWNDYREQITSVTINPGATDIRESSFSDCSNLRSVIIPESVTSIYDNAFRNCTSLTDITIPNGVTWIRIYAFDGCSSLTNITIPSSVTNIEEGAFEGCSSLKAITVENGNPSYCSEDGVLFTAGKTELLLFPADKDIGVYTIPAGVTSIAMSAFADNSHLTSVTIPDGVTTIGSSAFDGCSELQSVMLPSSVTDIYGCAFRYCFNLTDITIPNNVTTIGYAAFLGCSSIKSITIPGSVTSIGFSCFYGCGLQSAGPIGSGCDIEYGWETEIPANAFNNSYLTSVTIPGSVTSIGDSAFLYCNLSTVYYRGLPNRWEAITIGDNNDSLLNASFEYPGIYSGSCGENLTWALSSYSGELFISGTGAMSDWPIPMTGKSWGYIYAPWYKEHKDQITSVTIDNGVTSIGNYAFYDCPNLKSIAIPESVTSIGNGAFSTCSSLTGITLPSRITKIADSTFSNCSSLANVTIPASVTSIGNGAFSNCSSLFNITIPDSVTSIGGYAFQYCSSLTDITIPNGVSDIGERTFSYCSSLTGITIPGSVSSIGNQAFSGCSSLTEITIPSSVSSMGTSVFEYCDALSAITVESGNSAYCSENGVLFNIEKTELIQYPAKKAGTSYEIPNSVTRLADHAFYGSSLNNVTFPSELTDIGSGAFQACSGLTSISIPDHVTNIGYSAFAGCTNLTKIIIPESAVNIGWIGIFSSSNLKTAGPIGSGCNIEFGWKTAIPSYAFMGCSALASVTIPDTVTSIGAYAFSGCNSLTAMTLPASVTYIGSYAFQSCGGLTEITIPAGVTGIGDYTFAYCRGLTSVTIPNGATSIGCAAFYNCNALTGITIPASVRTIDAAAFAYCSTLPAITIPDGVTSMGRLVFYECKSLTKVIIPGTVTSIAEDGLFLNCPGIKTAGPIGSGCNLELGWTTDLPLAALFRDCSIENVTLPEGITTIEYRAFNGCSSLKSIVLPDTVISIEKAAFAGCSSLSDIKLPDGLESIREAAFLSCTSLTSITIPYSVTDLAMSAFRNCINLKSIFYGGTEEEWVDLSRNTGLDSVDLFSEEDYDEGLYVDFTTEEVPGGVKVSMTPYGSGTIYYTLNGTTPNAGSTPYTGSFLLNEAGKIFINAIIINTGSGTYGDVMTEYVDLEQSKIPEISEQAGTIVMNSTLTKPGAIYYSLDLTAEPTIASARYESPLLLTETTVVRAKVIETGKAPSAVASYAFYITAGGINYPDDSYSFPNTAESFGYGKMYRIKEEQYKTTFGSTYTKVFEQYYMKWGGSCFGMSATSLMFSRGVLGLKTYSDSAETVNALTAPGSRESELTMLIERYQIAQFLPDAVKERDDYTRGGTMALSGFAEGWEGTGGILDAVQKSCSGGEPIILLLFRAEGSSINGYHAVVPYKMAGGKIYIYDCNNPNGENYLTYSKDAEKGTYSFQYYDTYNNTAYTYGIAYNRLNPILEQLEGLATGSISLMANGKEQMLISLNTRKFQILDAEGNEVTNYIPIYASADMEQTRDTILYLDKGNYTIINKDDSLENLIVSAATATDYYGVAVEDASAEIEIGIGNGRLYMTVSCENPTDMTIQTGNASDGENEIKVTADYVKIYAYSDSATQIETTASGITGNGEEIDLSETGESGGKYCGAVGTPIEETPQETYEEETGIRVSTDITELVDNTFTLTASVTGAGESAVVYAAGYDEAGRMMFIRSRETQAGKTKYPFTIEAGTAEVKIYVLEKATNKPLTEVMNIR